MFKFMTGGINMYKEELKKVMDATVEKIKTSSGKEKQKYLSDLFAYRSVMKYVEKNEEDMTGYVDTHNHFIEIFNRKTGFYFRTGVIENNLDTGRDPFQRDFPQLIDVGIMGHCKHGLSGLCMKSGVQCYQDGLHRCDPNMTLEDFGRIVEECKGKTFQLSLGGRGDVDQHEYFEEIMKMCIENGITPNFTSSGLGFTEEIVEICKKYAGAVAISEYRQPHTTRALKMLIDAGVKTNLHYVLGNNSIDEAIERLKNHDFIDGLNAVIFLLHKPVGLGKESNVLRTNDPRVAEFYHLIDTEKFPFAIGFDTCNNPGILNFTSNILEESMDTCEAARHSCYIDSDMKMIPCSFDNQDLKWAVDLRTHTIQEAWNSKQFENFRDHFRCSCPNCKDRSRCMSGCPICRSIVLCDRKEKDLR